MVLLMPAPLLSSKKNQLVGCSIQQEMLLQVLPTESWFALTGGVMKELPGLRNVDKSWEPMDGLMEQTPCTASGAGEEPI